MSDVSSTPSIQLQGTVHPDSYFQIVERNKIDWQLWVDVLLGKVAGAIFRDVLNPELRQQICQNFWHSSTLMQKGKDLPSDYHYEALLGPSFTVAVLQSPEFYLAELERSSQDLEQLFGNTDNFFMSLMGNLREHLAKQRISLRQAEYNRRKTARYKMRCLGNAAEEFVLVPHDDNGPYKNPRFKDFEVNRLLNRRMIAVMMCIENGEGGELHYWNLCVNDETIDTLGFQGDNFGYPLQSLANFPKIVLPIHSGDLYLFDATNVHAIGDVPPGQKRLAISSFMGLLDSKTAIYWT